MAANVVFSHQQSGRALLRFNANATINVAANSTVNSDCAPTSNEAVTGATITKLYWSLPSGNVTISRGSNAILVLNGSDHWDLKADGCPLTEFPTATIVVAFSAAGGTLLMEVAKQYAGGTNHS